MGMGRSQRAGSAAWVVAAAWLSGCGPLVSLEEESETEAESGDVATTAPPPSTSTSSPPGTTSPPPPPPGTTTSPPSDDSTSGPAMTSLVFIETWDQGDGYECDLWQQDCPPGQKCMPWANDGGSSWNSTRCSPIAEDPDAPGEPCTVEGSGVSGIDSCALGSMCWDVDPETLEGECVAFCVGSPEQPMCEDPNATCVQNGDGSLILCLLDCDPLLQDCDEDEACYPVQDDWQCAPDASGASGAYGDVCEFINVCDPGYVCLDSSAVPPGQPCEGATGCCTAVCNLADPLGDAQCEGAAGGQTCQPWYEDGTAPPGYELVGVCALP